MNPATEHLFDAILTVDVAGVRQALADGADVNARHPMGKATPMHWACYKHGSKTFRSLAVSPKTELIAQILLEAGADLTLRDGLGPYAKQLGFESSCRLPAAWAEQGEMPRCVHRRMQELAAAQHWPEPETDGTGNPAMNGKVGSYVGRGIFRKDKYARAA